MAERARSIGRSIVGPATAVLIAVQAVLGGRAWFRLSDEAERVETTRAQITAQALAASEDVSMAVSPGDAPSLESAAKTSSEVRFLRADRPGDALHLIARREPLHEYDVDHRGDRFYIRTNKGAKNFRVVTAPVADASEAHWTELIAHRPDVKIAGVDLFAGHLVLSEWEGGLQQIEVVDLATRGVQLQPRQRTRLSAELLARLVEVIEVEVRIAERVDEVARAEPRHLRDHVGQQRV